MLLDIWDFDTERGYDILTLGEDDDSFATGSIIAKLSGIVLLKRFFSLGDRMWITFTSDKTGSRRGFFIVISELVESDFTGIYGRFGLF